MPINDRERPTVKGEDDERFLEKVKENNDALRKHFLELREKCKPGMDTHREIVTESMGDEII